MKRFFLITVLSIIVSGLIFIIAQSTMLVDKGRYVIERSTDGWNTIIDEGWVADYQPDLKNALYFSFIVFSLIMIANILWELGLKNIIERNNRNKIIVVFYCLWSFMHLTILFASLIQDKSKSGFWPFDGVHSLNISSYDYSEFAVYLILPTAVLLTYWFISGHHKIPNTERNNCKENGKI